MPENSSEPLYAIACPSGDLCVAGDFLGRVLITLAPTADRLWWAFNLAAGPIAALTCPSVSLCVAVVYD